MQPYSILKILRDASKRAPIDNSRARVCAEHLGLLDASGRVTPRGNEELEQFRNVQPRIERTARDVVAAVVGRDLNVAQFRCCGLAIGYAIDRSWLVRDSGGLIQITDLGADTLPSNLVPIGSTWE